MIRINRFGGIAPIMEPQKLPEPFATIATDCLFEGGNLKPVPGKETLAINYPAQTHNKRSLFRISDLQWLVWPGDVSVIRGPTPVVSNYLGLGDDYRIYYAGYHDPSDFSTVQWPRFTSKYRAMGNSNPGSFFETPAVSYPLGVPPPQSGPACAASAAPTGTISAIRAQNPVLVECTTAHGLSTGNRVRLSGLPGSGNTEGMNGAQYAITVVNTTQFKLDSVDGSEWESDSTGLSGTWTRVYADSEVEDRIYVYTYVNEFGEEGMPSSPSAIVSVGDGQSVTVTTDTNATVTPSNSPSFTVSAKRIYRSVSGSDAAQYLFVAEVAIATVNYEDTVSVEVLGEVLSTETYELPPAKLQGIKLHPNGFVVGFYDNVLCVSEPYLPYAWPTDYRKTFGSTIVGIEIFGQTIVVVTDGKPRVGTATDPSSLNLREIEEVLPGTSRQGICSTGRSVVYVSPSGLVAVDEGGARIVTKQYFSAQQWALTYALTVSASDFPTALEFQDGRLWMSVYSLALYSFDMHDDGRIDVVGYSSYTPSALFVDRQSDTLFVMDYSLSAANIRLHQFNKYGTARSFSWSSRRFHLPREINMGAMQVFATSYGAGISVTVSASEGSNSRTYTVTNQDPVRLASGFLSRDWMVTIAGTREIQGAHLAESIEELRQAAL